MNKKSLFGILIFFLISLLTGCSVSGDKAEVEQILNKSQSTMQQVPIYIDYKMKMTSPPNLPKEKYYGSPGPSDVHAKIHYVDDYNVSYQVLKKIINNDRAILPGPKEEVFIDGYHWYYEDRALHRGNERTNVTKVLISRIMNGGEFLVSKPYHFNRAKKLADQLEVKDEGDTYLIEGDIDGNNGVIDNIKKSVFGGKDQTGIALILDHEYRYVAPNATNTTRFESVNMKLWIDKKTYLLKKVETTSKMIRTYKADDNTEVSYPVNLKETFEYQKAPNTIPKPKDNE